MNHELGLDHKITMNNNPDQELRNLVGSIIWSTALALLVVVGFAGYVFYKYLELVALILA